MFQVALFDVKQRGHENAFGMLAPFMASKVHKVSSSAVAQGRIAYELHLHDTIMSVLRSPSRLVMETRHVL